VRTARVQNSNFHYCIGGDGEYFSVWKIISQVPAIIADDPFEDAATAGGPGKTTANI
jgi:hypothetical protein